MLRDFCQGINIETGTRSVSIQDKTSTPTIDENMPPTNHETEASLKSDKAIKNEDIVETANENESTDSNNKRFAADEIDPVSSSKRPRHDDGEVLDLAQTMGLTTGDRLEVRWEIEMNDDTITRWWGASLLEHDGKTEEGVAVRVLEYDPFPDGGFPESSKEEVIFMRHDLLINYSSQEEAHYRLLSDDNSEVVWVRNDDIEDLVNTILTKAMQKTASNFSALPRSQQALLAEKIAEKKEKLVQLLKDHMEANRAAGVNRVLTARDAESLLAMTMKDG